MPVQYLEIVSPDTPASGAHTYRVQVRAGEAAVTVTMGEGGQTQQIAAIELN
ncbi:MAG: hypothetical protein IPH44_26930 [Myxococcales bacterium]|nr:hypothetical protein [Myxococcales bacterium]MBP6845932.1 hypothetical protein [Kofleriaceae bacterium]